MKLRNSLINMLGEFVGLHKTPDFKLNAQSSQAIVEAVAAESRRYSLSMNYSSSHNTESMTHQRSLSTNSTHELYEDKVLNMDPSYRRLSEPTSLPSFTPPRQRHIEQRLLIHSQKKKSRKQSILMACIDHLHTALHIIFLRRAQNLIQAEEKLIRCSMQEKLWVDSYVFWSQSEPQDIGKATRNALTIGRRLSPNWHYELTDVEKEAIHQEVLNNVKNYNVGSLSNGCLMRISPLAIYSVNIISIPRIEEMVRADCSLTHYEEDTKQAVFSYVLAVRDLLNGKSNKEAFETALNATQSARIRGHLLTAQEKPIPINIGDQFVDGDGKAMGYVGVALQNAFYELLHGTSFAKSLTDAISRGGDTDTNAAIVGALLGAQFGVDDIPEQWINTMKEGKPRANFNTIDYNVERIVSKLLMMN
ncbi:ADP-ribosyl-[dinitrogen reductase] glycohydrolase [Dirofilaria immitis]